MLGIPLPQTTGDESVNIFLDYIYDNSKFNKIEKVDSRSWLGAVFNIEAVIKRKDNKIVPVKVAQSQEEADAFIKSHGEFFKKNFGQIPPIAILGDKKSLDLSDEINSWTGTFKYRGKILSGYSQFFDANCYQYLENDLGVRIQAFLANKSKGKNKEAKEINFWSIPIPDFKKEP